MMHLPTPCIRCRASALRVMDLSVMGWVRGVAIGAAVVLSACSWVGLERPLPASNIDAASLSTQLPWTLLDLTNTSSTHTAANTINSLLETHLRRQGVGQLDDKSSVSRYAVQGEVSRWHYAGLASLVPAVTMRVDVHDLSSNTLVWSDVVSGEGRRRENLTGFADRLIGSLVERMPLNDTLIPATQEMIASVVSSRQSMGASDDYSSSSMGALGLRTSLQGSVNESIQTDEPLSGRSVAFYYADKPPIDILSQFDRLVLEPDNITATQLQQLTADNAAAFAYLSIGEVGPTRDYARDIHADWVLGKNPTWDSQVLDLANTQLQQFLVNRVAELHANGYQGVFLDTMDSFNLFAKSAESKAAQQAGLIKIIRRIAIEYPELRIITNRGFEVIDQLAEYVEAVAAESLYASWDNAGQRYKSVSDNDRQWLLSKLDHVKNKLGLDVIAIDYLPPASRDEARAVARKIAQHGYIPWVTNPALDYVGVGALEVIPRKVLLVFDSRSDGALAASPVHRFVATPLEYLGYVPTYVDMATDALPSGQLKGRYAGVATWPVNTYESNTLRTWLQKQMKDELPVAMFSLPPVDITESLADSLGITVTREIDLDSAVMSYSDELIKPEITISQRLDSMGLVASSTANTNTTHMSYGDDSGNTSDVVVTGRFGGFAWQPGVVTSGLDYETYWNIDPFNFLQTALRLPAAPMPDVTSENGKRLWLAHIDGDALPSWAEMPGGQLGAEVIYDRILSKYSLPHTVSVVEAEMTEFAAFDDRRQRMFDIARKTFQLDTVEIASHTYSHPFKWKELGAYTRSGKYNMAIPGYEYSSEREIQGSINFIDEQLAPSGKRTKVMLWSGDALPQLVDLQSVDRLGIPNMNGGVTRVTRSQPTLTFVSPMARPVGGHLQVYAPIMNENIYTDNWLGPFDGFRNVIETFEMTDVPRRLKPLNIYYHFYSGTKIASMRALEEVYDWSVKQDIFPLYVSEYARKVPDYRQAGVARYLDGRWKLSRLGTVRSIRMLSKQQWPELHSSYGLTGVRTLHDGLYVHTTGSDSVSFQTTLSKPAGIHLVSSNGRVESWDVQGTGLKFRIVGNVPVIVELGGAIARSCTIQAKGQRVRGKQSDDDTMIFTFTTRDTGNAILNCQA